MRGLLLRRAAGLAFGLCAIDGLSAFAATPDSASTPRTEGMAAVCDSLAADPDDPRRRPGSAGIPFDKIDAGRAIIACGAALAADPSDVQRQYQLGRAYLAKREFAVAIDALRKADERGYPVAAFELGRLYLGGIGVAKNAKEGATYVWKAGEGGVVPAIQMMAILYYLGEGISENKAEARIWFNRAAEAGDASAMYTLGMMLRDGEGGPQEPKAARALFRKAAEAGEVSAMDNYGAMLANGQGGRAESKQARSWFRKAAEAGDFGGMVHLGQFMAAGLGGPRDVKGARAWLEKAAASGKDYAVKALAAFEETQAKRPAKKK